MMLEHLGHPEAAAAIEGTIEAVLRERQLLTPDMGGKGTTKALGTAIAQQI